MSTEFEVKFDDQLDWSGLRRKSPVRAHGTPEITICGIEILRPYGPGFVIMGISWLKWENSSIYEWWDGIYSCLVYVPLSRWGNQKKSMTLCKWTCRDVPSQRWCIFTSQTKCMVNSIGVYVSGIYHDIDWQTNAELIGLQSSRGSGYDWGHDTWKICLFLNIENSK